MNTIEKTIQQVRNMSKEFPGKMTEKKAKYEANSMLLKNLLSPYQVVILDFDPNLVAFTIQHLMDIFKPFVPDESSRYRMVIEGKMMVIVPQIEAARKLNSILNSAGDIKVNIAVGDKIPKNFYQLPPDIRVQVYPEKTIAGYGKKPHDFVHKMASPQTGEIIILVM